MPVLSSVSVIIPVHNGERYLAAALESVFAQTRACLEVIVIDDASTDTTPRILAGYGERIQVIRHATPQGPARARNEGVQRARGAYIAFLDADDLWEPEKIEGQLAFAANHADFGIITTDVIWFDDDGTILQSTLKKIYPVESGQVVEKLLYHNWITTSATLIPRRVLIEIGGFDEQRCRLGEDWVLWMRIASKYPVYFLEQVLTRRRVHADSLGHGDPETSFRDLLRHLDTLQQQVPQLREKPELVQRARYRICINRAMDDFHALRMLRAREKFNQARRYRPASLRSWLGLAATRIPAGWVRRLKLLRHRRPMANSEGL
jgi:glycosyltransferase involved in cell wall biosynthesis